MSAPSTKTLDHIIHLTPPGSVEQVSQQFRELGFNVIPGGVHAGGLSANALVVLSDGVYLELISFTHPASHYPPGSPERRRRDTEPWGQKPPGWIDISFLGSSTTSITDLINARAEREGTSVRYAPETHGGRTRASDGRVLRWVISATAVPGLRGTVPFFCGDVTPRTWRVPVYPPENTRHPSGVRGIAHVRLLAEPESLARVSAQLTTVIGEPPHSNMSSRSSEYEYVWTLGMPPCGGEQHGCQSMEESTGTSSAAQKPRLILSAPTNDEEEDHLKTKGPGIYEVAFSVGQDGVERESKTPYGKIVWSRS